MERNWLRILLTSDIWKGIFSFSSYFYIKKLAFGSILADFHQCGNSLPPPQPCCFGRRGPGGRTRSVDDLLCSPTKWKNCLFLKDAHTGLLCHPACSAVDRVSLESFLPSHSEDRNSYSMEILTLTASWSHSSFLQPLVLIDLSTLMN